MNNSKLQKHTIWKKATALLLTAALLTGSIPAYGGASEVHAEEASRTIAGLRTQGIASPTAPASTQDAWKGSYVYFGNYDVDGDGTAEPVRYRVLDGSTTDYNAGKENASATMLIDCEKLLYAAPFDKESPYNNIWAESNVRQSLNGADFLEKEGVFTPAEKAAIAESTVEGHAYTEEEVPYWTQATFENYVALNGEKIFALDIADVMNPAYGYSKYELGCANRLKEDAAESQKWWLRSALASYEGKAAIVDHEGYVNHYSIKTDVVRVSPAMNINLSSVLYTTVVTGTAGEEGAEYKLTLRDADIAAAVTDCTRDGDALTVSYQLTGENAGQVTQLAVMITDKEYDDPAAKLISYETVGTKNPAAKGEVSCTMPQGMEGAHCGEDYYAYLVAEDVNDGYETDYASEPAAIEVPDEKIKAVSVTVKTPNAGEAFRDSLCTAEGDGAAEKIKTVSAVWTKDGQAVTGNAGYYTSYQANVTLTPSKGYAFSDAVTVTVNQKTVDADRIVYGEDGTITIDCGSYRTRMARLLQIPEQPAVTNVKHAAAKTAEALGLPEKAVIQTEDADIREAEVIWKLDDVTDEMYDPSCLTEQTFTVEGTVILPDEIWNTYNISLTTTISVTVMQAETVSAPRADLEPGTYRENQTVRLTVDTEGADIYYTTDGSAPDAVHGNLYTDAIEINGTEGESVLTRLRAIAVKQGCFDSEEGAYEYVIQLPKQLYRAAVTGIELPAGGKAFDTKAECAALGENGKELPIAWTTADGSETEGIAQYNTLYTAGITLRPEDGSVFAENMEITVNGAAVEADRITRNADGTITLHVDFVTAKAKLLEVIEPEAVTDIENGADKTAEALKLPKTVAIRTEDASVSEAEVIWQPEAVTDAEYDPALLKEQTFTVRGNVVLPDSIDPDGIELTAVVSVTVNKKTMLYQAEITELTVPTGRAGFDTEAVCTTEGVAARTLSVTWTKGSTRQPVNTAQETADFNTLYTAEFTLRAAEGYAFADGLKVTVNGEGSRLVHNADGTVTVSCDYVTGKIKLLGVAMQREITGLKNGTPKTAEALKLPKTITIRTEAEEINTASVVWDVSSVTGYDPQCLIRQGFYVSGKVILPDGVDRNKRSLTVTVPVTVEAAPAGTRVTAKDGSTYTLLENPQSGGMGRVEYTASKKGKKGTVTVPDTIAIGGFSYAVVSIGKNACAKNKKITGVKLGKNVAKIGAKAFYGCKRLKNITIKTTKLTKKTVGSKAFVGIRKKAVIKVPKKKLKTYRKLLKKYGVGAKAKWKKLS